MPTRWTVPLARASGRSVVSRITRTGFPTLQKNNIFIWFKELYKSCQTIEGELRFVSNYCPDNQRKDFIQSTLDFFNYGVYVVIKSDGTRIYFGGYSYGWTKRIKYLVEYIGYAWVDCYDLYNDRKYEDVAKKYKEMNEYIDKELFGEQHSYENILKEYNKLTENNK